MASKRSQEAGRKAPNLNEVHTRLVELLEELLNCVDEEIGLDSAAFASQSVNVLAYAVRNHQSYALVQMPIEEKVPLTERQREIAVLASYGMKNKTIAFRLGISSATVAAHLRHIYRKLEISSRTELAHRTKLLS